MTRPAAPPPPARRTAGCRAKATRGGALPRGTASPRTPIVSMDPP